MSRATLLAGLLTVALVGGLLLAQEKKPDPPKDPPTPPTKTRGQLRPGWKQLGLTDEQKQNVYKIQNEYGVKIDALEAQVKELKQKMEADEFKLLTDAQKARLKEIFSSKVPGDKPETKPPEKKPDPAKPVENKTDEKKP